ncbi:NrpR regulatory domain-containing protein [bacterium]|nr:NrpR regulatory domain-containing protein [bacterium]
MPEIGRKEFAILRILGEHGGPVGAGLISRQLGAHGIELTDRAIRYHLQALDEAGLTRNLGRAGRELTEAGQAELANARVADQVALTFAKIERLAYLTRFDLEAGSGKIVINLSLFRQAEFDAAMKVMRPVFLSRWATSDLIATFQPGQKLGDQAIPRGMVGLGTVSAVTLNGVLLSHGIPVQSEFGGLVEVAGHEPVRFTEIIRYGGTSIDPVEVFIKGKATSVQQVVTTGRGKVGAGFRICPAIAREHVMRLVDAMSAWRLRGVAAIGAESRPLMETEVGVDRMGLVICAGLNPIAAAEEAGYSTVNRAMSGVFEYADMEAIG